jgi:hypothetical protein
MVMVVAGRMSRRGVIIQIMMIVESVVIPVMAEIQGDIAEQHMMMFMMAHDKMLDISDSTGDSRLGEDQRQRDAKHRARLLPKAKSRAHG